MSKDTNPVRIRVDGGPVLQDDLIDLIRQCLAAPDCDAERMARRIAREFAGMRFEEIDL